MNFPSFVKEKWNFTGDMFHSLNDFTTHVKEWNKLVYGFIGARKKRLMNSLSHIQSALERSSSSRLL